MLRISHVLGNLCASTLWRLRPREQREQGTSSPVLPDGNQEESAEQDSLRALVRRFPYWTEGRALLAKKALNANDIATAYAEAQALLALAPKNSHFHVVALFEIGRCFLRRSDAASALAFLDQAHGLRPKDSKIQEERSAALVLQGDKARALEILKAIPAADLSAEGKAAMQWLSRDRNAC